MNTIKQYLNENGLYPSDSQLHVLYNRALAYNFNTGMKYQIIDGEQVFPDETLDHVLTLLIDGKIVSLDAVRDMTKEGEE